MINDERKRKKKKKKQNAKKRYENTRTLKIPDTHQGLAVAIEEPYPHNCIF